MLVTCRPALTAAPAHDRGATCVFRVGGLQQSDRSSLPGCPSMARVHDRRAGSILARGAALNARGSAQLILKAAVACARREAGAPQRPRPQSAHQREEAGTLQRHKAAECPPVGRTRPRNVVGTPRHARPYAAAYAPSPTREQQQIQRPSEVFEPVKEGRPQPARDAQQGSHKAEESDQVRMRNGEAVGRGQRGCGCAARQCDAKPSAVGGSAELRRCCSRPRPRSLRGQGGQGSD